MTITGLLHAYREPAVSRAKTRSTENARRKTVPRTSMRANADLVNLVFRWARRVVVVVGWEEGRKRAMRMREMEPPGALDLNFFSIST